VKGIRRRTWEILEVAAPGDDPSRVFDLAIRGLIVLNVLAVVAETIPEVDAAAGAWFTGFEIASVAVFSVEYLLRVWSAPESGRYGDGLAGRTRFALTPLALIDLFAVLPAYLPMVGVDLRILRGVRLVRLVRILKLVRYSRALRSLGRAVQRRWEELVLTFSMVGLVVLIASSLMYYAEHPMQPEAFGSIPEAMWWGVVTLTTLGYGDVVPVTVLGRVMGGVFALCSLLLVALPTAILAGAFVEELDAPSPTDAEGRSTGGPGPRAEEAGSRARESGDVDRCPHCGRPLDGGGGA